MIKRFYLSLLVALLLLPSMDAIAQEALKREMRTVWIATVSNIDWPRTRGVGESTKQAQQKQLTDLLDGFVKANMNAICLQVRPMADALYRSSYEPWSSYVSGTRGVDPGWDPLEFAVEECHKRGLECHVWVNPYRFSNSGGRDCNTAQDQELKNSGLLMQVNDQIVFNPALEGSRQRVVNVCREMIENYDIDGLIFDDYFYPGNGTPTNSSAPDYQLWRDANSGMSIADWRRANVNLMVRNVYDMVQETRPGVKFGIGPAGVAGTAATSASKHGIDPCPTGSDWQYNQIYSDPIAWLEEGTIDYISPQLYWKCNHSTNPFGPLTQWWSYVANHFGKHHYASHSISFLSSSNTEADWAEIVQQIRYSRQYNLDKAPGVNFYSAKYINGPTCTGLADYLKATVFTNKALTPAMTWKTRKYYDAPANAQIAGSVISWDPINERAQIKYAVYAIPNGVPVDNIQSVLYSGIKGDYLVAVTWNSTYTLPTNLRDGYWYAVTVIDGWGNENPPAYINAPSGDAEQVTLLSPVGTTLTKWKQTFRWTAATNARYRLQIADSETFENILISRENISANEVIMDISSLASATTYYWRVITSQNGHFDKASEVASFVTMQRPFAPLATLLSPANGTDIDGDFTVEYSVPAEVTSSKVQFAADDTFDQVLYESDAAQSRNGHLALDVQAGLLGKGTFYWRVVTTANDCDPGVSQPWSFTVLSIPTGSYEPGYVVKRDINTYEPIDGMTLTNRWVRSVKDEYNNIIFDNSGLMNRGFTVKDGHLLMVGRTAGSSDAQVYIAHYEASTGERIKTVNVSDDVHALYYPGNDIFLDDAGNVLISNLVLDIANQPIVIHQVDPETGEAVLRASLTATGTATTRIDHCNVLGDVSTGNFMVYAALSSGNQVIRWTVRNGAVTATKVVRLIGLYPSLASNLGLAPRVYPVDVDLVYVTGGSTHLSLYDLETGDLADSFQTNTGIQPENTEANGANWFSLNGKNYMFYPYSDFRGSTGFRFTLAENVYDNQDFIDYNQLWVFPEQGLGGVNSQTWDAPCVSTPGARSNQRELYMMVPGNGLAAYTLTLPLTGDINHDGQVDVTDVSLVIDMVLGKQEWDMMADFNGDGAIDVTDVSLLIDIVLGK